MGFALCVTAFSHHQGVNSSGRLVVNYSMKTSLSTTSYSSKYSSTGQLLALPGSDNPKEFLKHKAKELAQSHEALVRGKRRERTINFEKVHIDGIPDSKLLDMSHDRCHELFLMDTDPHVMGLFLLQKKELRALCAVWAWGRRLDNLVDGITGSHATTDDLVRWRKRTIDIYEGRPWDIYDVALTDSFSKFPLNLQLFLDLIEGTKLDITRRTHESYDQICLYRYYIASTFFVMLLQIFGISPTSNVPLEKVYSDSITYGFALAEVDTLRDLASDLRMGRMYLLPNELALAGVSTADVYRGEVTENWRNFMRGQVRRTKTLLDVYGEVINEIDIGGRWWLWTIGLLYSQDLDVIEAMDYQNLTKNVSRGKVKTLSAFVFGYLKARGFV